jgi:hypothetical protein
MSSFERRGLPFRDEFDSAFDELIYVDHLKFDLAQKLLMQRILGRPIPFFALSYCLSGGLPRDLIRSFRSILEIDEGRSGLSLISGRLLKNDVVAKARAVGTSLRKVSLEPQVDIAIEGLHRLELAANDNRKLAELAESMIQQSFLAGELPGLGGLPFEPVPDGRLQAAAIKEGAESTAKLQQVQELVEEIATYALFVVALRRFFTDELTKGQLIALIKTGDIDRLAEARRYIGVNPSIARSIMKDFCERYLKPYESTS